MPTTMVGIIAEGLALGLNPATSRDIFLYLLIVHR